MQLFLISSSSKKTLSITLNPLLLSVFFVVISAVGFLAFYAGSLYSSNLAEDRLQNLYAQIAPSWNEEMKLQQQNLVQTKADSEQSLNALATYLSKLQAHVVRLDALGSRLADLNGMDFDISNTLGLGGPESPIEARKTIGVNDFLIALEQLNLNIQDRSEKLIAMESMLIDSALRNQTTPTGNPTIDGWVTSLFGMRADPITGKMDFHSGVDYAGREGSPVLAVASGIVTWSGIRHGYGNIVEINHGNGYQTRYAHNKKNIVVVGQKVDKGQIIALMGSTGRSTGPHVHLEVVSNGKIVNPKKLISLK